MWYVLTLETLRTLVDSMRDSLAAMIFLHIQSIPDTHLLDYSQLRYIPKRQRVLFIYMQFQVASSIRNIRQII